MPTKSSLVLGSVVASMITCGLTGALLAQTPAGASAKAAPKAWPEAREMEKRRADAEKLPLFADAAPFELTLTADFKAIQSDRNPESTKLFPATVQVAAKDGSMRSANIQVRTRGHARRSFNTCDFAPLRIEFQKDKMKGTVFEDQEALKLGVHCREGVKEFEQYVLREYAAYRIYNLVTPQSFRARLARVTYVDAVKQKPISTRFGMFIEDDGDVAKRMGGRLTEEKEDLVRLDRDAFTRSTLFQYLIGNVDMSIITFHNFVAVQMPTGPVYSVPYDFDYSGLVNASYATPAPNLGITSVRDRLFRGPCRPEAELQPFFEKFRAIRPDIIAMYDSLPALFDAGAKKKAISYLDGFYKTIEKPAEIKKSFIDTCLKRGLM